MKWFLFLLVGLAGCDHTSFRTTVKQEEIFVSPIEHEGHDYLAFKERNGDGYATVSIVHDPNCEKCKTP